MSTQRAQRSNPLPIIFALTLTAVACLGGAYLLSQAAEKTECNFVRTQDIDGKPLTVEMCCRAGRCWVKSVARSKEP